MYMTDEMHFKIMYKTWVDLHENLLFVQDLKTYATFNSTKESNKTKTVSICIFNIKRKRGIYFLLHPASSVIEM